MNLGWIGQIHATMEGNKSSGTGQISSDGIFTPQGDETVRCTVDSDKTIMVCTDSWIERSNGSSAPILIDAFQFSGTQNYCCWTSDAYAWFGSNFFNPGSSLGEPSNARNAPDGRYAEMRTPGFSLMTGTNAVPQNGIKVYIASGNTGTYQVWGGNTIPTSLCSYGIPYYTCDLLDLGNNPENYGFTYLGRSNATQEFLGDYLYYIVKTGWEDTTSIEIFTKAPN